MSLPKRKSRVITIDSSEYRYLISNRNNILSLSVESSENSQQLLQAFFSPHDSYKQGKDKKWKKVKQGIAITPKTVRKIIEYGLTNGWQPNVKNTTAFELYTWITDSLIPELLSLNSDEKRIKDIATEQIDDLRFDLSLDPDWRKKLFHANTNKKFVLSSDYFALSQEVRDCGLKFAVSNAGWTDDGFVVFQIESVDFPDLATYTTNNPAII